MVKNQKELITFYSVRLSEECLQSKNSIIFKRGTTTKIFLINEDLESVKYIVCQLVISVFHLKI